jgi:DNA-binding PadR family transcriptional regulator
MSAFKNQDKLTILAHLSRKDLNEQELIHILGHENAKKIMNKLVKEEMVNKDGIFSVTRKGLKNARHSFEKPSQINSKGKKRRGLIQLAILQLLKEEPMHGYQVMKLLEERSDGFYTPSAGTIYPALQDLHDRGLISIAEQAEKKVYELHSDGRLYLSEVVIDEDDVFWEEWRLRLMWKQSKQAGFVREEMDKFTLESQVAMRYMMQEPERAEELISIIKNAREQVINWSEQQERKQQSQEGDE